MPDVEKNEESKETEESKDSENLGSDVMRCALGLIMYKLGVNFYDCEEASDSLVHLKKSF